MPQTSFGSPSSHSISTALRNVEQHQLHAEGRPLPARGQQVQAPPGAASSGTGGTAGSSVSGTERQISRSPWKSSCQPPTSAALPALSPLSQHLPEAQGAAEEQKAAGTAESFHVGLLGSGVHSQLSVSENLFPFCFPRQKFSEGNAGLSGGGCACPPSAAVLQTLSCRLLHERAGLQFPLDGTGLQAGLRARATQQLGAAQLHAQQISANATAASACTLCSPSFLRRARCSPAASQPALPSHVLPAGTRTPPGHTHCQCGQEHRNLVFRIPTRPKQGLVTIPQQDRS